MLLPERLSPRATCTVPADADSQELESCQPPTHQASALEHPRNGLLAAWLTSRAVQYLPRRDRDGGAERPTAQRCEQLGAIVRPNRTTLHEAAGVIPNRCIHCTGIYGITG